MARIPDDDISRLKTEISLERLVISSGVELKRQGKDLVGHCPLHTPDNTPSLLVSTTKNLWHCMGACQQGGSVIDWVMKTRRVGFRDAVDLLRTGEFATRAPTPPPAVNLVLDSSDQQLLAEVVGYYHDCFKKNVDAQQYIFETRGLTNSELVDQFLVGYVDHTLGHHLPNRAHLKGREMRERLHKIGLTREGSGRELFHGCVVFPVLDENRQVLGIYGRRMRPIADQARHLYMPGPRRGVFNVEAIRVSKEIILCESVIDALTFWSAGFRNVTCSWGVEGFSDDIFNSFQQAKTERVLIAYDRDDAGDAAAAKLSTRLMEAGMDCYRVQFPKGMDANEYALKVKPADRSLAMAVRKAEWLGKGAAPARAESAAILIPTVTTEDWSQNESSTPAESPSTIAEAFAPLVTQEPKAQVEESKAQLREDSFPLATAVTTPAPPKTVMEVLASPVLGGDVKLELKNLEVTLMLGDRHYRVRGLTKNMSAESLRVNVFVVRGERFFGDTLQLNQLAPRERFIKGGAVELGVSDDVMKRDVGQLWLALERLQSELINKAKEPQNKIVLISDDDRGAALKYLSAKDLLVNMLDDFDFLGIVGEEMNKLTGYIAAVSRKLEKPLAVLVQSASAAGKSSLMDAVLAMMPKEEVSKYSAMTGQSLYYLGKKDLRHKILALAEEEGAERASYALKLLQSEGELTIASTGKDASTGELETKEYHVEGPVMIFQTTTAIEMDEELLNRCIVLTVDEGREQTRAIHRAQRMQNTSEWVRTKKQRDDIIKLHQNAQRLLRPMRVINPYSQFLTFPDEKMRLRRDHNKYLTLINAVTLLHQYQRKVTTEDGGGGEGGTNLCVEVTLEDIRIANQLAHVVLGRSLDELPPQTREMLMLIEKMVSECCAREKLERSEALYSRRAIREYTGWSNTQIKVHIDRLVDLEYVLPHRGRRGQSFVYELIYDGKGKDGAPVLCGLLEPEELARRSKEKFAGVGPKFAGVNEEFAGGLRAQNGVKTGGFRDLMKSKTPHQNGVKHDLAEIVAETHRSSNGAVDISPLSVSVAGE